MMNLTYEQIIEDMKACEQTKGMSVLEHGELVRYYYTDLIDHLINGDQLEYHWKLPEWVYTHKDLIISKLMDDEIMKNYQIFHDIGKPYCREVDGEGKQHFPNHASKSYEIYSHLYPEQKTVADLIKKIWLYILLKLKRLRSFPKTR
jgi:hypothetical protein